MGLGGPRVRKKPLFTRGIKMVGQENSLVLEQMIDKCGLKKVLEALSEICYEKGDHVLTNWQDKPLACSWGRDAARIGQLVNKTEN